MNYSTALPPSLLTYLPANLTPERGEGEGKKRKMGGKELETDRQTDRQTERQTDRQTDRGMYETEGADEE